jgi:serine/threonine-protein kinase
VSAAPAERWGTVRRVFDAAVDLPREQRDEFLAEADLDADTREEVRMLLDASDSAMDLPADRAPTPASAVPERMPEVLGYRLVRRLAHGGSSRVFEGESLENGRTVAVKVINSCASSSGLHRFRQECRVLSRLKHPGIVQLFETGHTPDGHVYLAMEFVRGRCIDAWASAEPATIAQRTHAMIEVLGALAHAHAAGVVHRDIKPHNILVEDSGRVRLVDFGVARLHRDDGQRTGFHTETGNLVGTFAYMSPEQADGKSGRIGPATDVYQCAMVLYELLTGRLPYEIEDRGAMALLKAILFDRRVPACEANPLLDERLAAVIDRALARDPAERPQTATLFADQLSAAVA